MSDPARGGIQRGMQKRMAPEAGSENLPMVDVYLPMMKSAAIITAGQLGLFEALADGALDAVGLAAALDCSVTGVERLAGFLVAVGYLRREGPRFANSPHARRWFTSGGETDYTAGLKWTAESWGLMATLTDCVRRGTPRTAVWTLMEERPSWGATFSGYMHAFARHLNPDLLAHLELPVGSRRLLDLGGSHGEHSIAFCRRHPGLSAVIVDHASALTETAQTIAAAGLSSRISLRHGDLRDEPWGDEYDVVLFLSVMHNQTAEDNQRTVKRIAQVLNPGGVLLIHEYPDDEPGSAFNAAFRLTLLTETGTTMPTTGSIAGWLEEAGLSPARRVPLSPVEKGTLFISRKG